jgi:hypothetical protein
MEAGQVSQAGAGLGRSFGASCDRTGLRYSGPALHDTLVAIVVGVLQLQPRHHQPYRQARPARVADTGTDQHVRRAEQIRVGDGATHARPMGKQRRQRCFDVRLGHARGQRDQRMAHVDHRVQTGSKEIVGGHRLQVQSLLETGLHWIRSTEL